MLAATAMIPIMARSDDQRQAPTSGSDCMARGLLVPDYVDSARSPTTSYRERTTQ